jgi:hypothetical protein
VHGDLHEHILGGSLRVLHEDVEVAVVVEYPRIEELVFRLVLAARPVGGEQVGVGYSPCGYLYSIFRYEEVGVASR